MEAIKRIELIVHQPQVRAVVQILHDSGHKGYTLIEGVKGSGERGEQDAEGLTDSFKNALFIFALPEADANQLLEKFRPLIKKSGGVCLVSDALWLKH
jgi:nitrogen regulatory protein PII